MSASVKQEFLSAGVLVDEFMLSKRTEQMVFNMRNPSNLPVLYREHRRMEGRYII